MSRTIEVLCDVDIERTRDSFHAHAVPEGIEIRPGDAVLLHDAPSAIGFGERITCQCRATVMRAGPLGRAWQHLVGMLELTELYEVGFQAQK